MGVPCEDIWTEGADELWQRVAGTGGQVGEESVMRAQPLNAGRKITHEPAMSVALGHPSRCHVLKQTPQSLGQAVEFVNDRLRLRRLLVTHVL